jgi:hypothetical protein
MDRKAHSRPQLETFNRPCGPNGFDVTRIAADEVLDPGQNIRPGSQITETRKPSDEPLCLADFNHPLTVAPWLRPRNAGLLAPIKDNTSFERSVSAAGRSAVRCIMLLGWLACRNLFLIIKYSRFS